MKQGVHVTNLAGIVSHENDPESLFAAVIGH